ncbi:MAG: lipoyl(octanoyl) transferase LipB [Deltaproteobacteria bacterium]|nr:lipoyl(octanoyl) transferase LipB [Deltaproteobacteria bacterium]
MRPLIYTTDLGPSDYRTALRMQHALHTRCRTTRENVLMLTEHYPVVTLGYRCLKEQLRLPATELTEKGITLAEVERGDGATYHGPGQLVVYPIFSSLLRPFGVRGFVARLEEIMSRVSHYFGVAAVRRPELPGIWVGERKLGAVGIAVRRGVSLHGCALNVNLDLQPFAYIIPCGLSDTAVTSLKNERGMPITMSEVVLQTRRNFAAVFAATLEEMPDEWCSFERTASASALDYHQSPRAA